MHLELDAPIAIKFEHPTPDTDETGARHESKRRNASRREAQVAARLRSPNVVRTVDFGTDDGIAFIAMELLVGESLAVRLERENRLSPHDVSEIVRQTASALDLAHRERVVHRDIKPSNLFLAREGDHELVKVLDFGIAKWLDADASGEAHTDSARLVGSAAYMSPEQARGEAVDHRSDVWALAVVAHEMLFGERAFSGSNIPDTLRRICAGDYRRPSARLGREYVELDGILARALELNPARRFQSAGELARALDSVLQRVPSPSTPCVWLEANERHAFGRLSETVSYRGMPPLGQFTRGKARSAIVLAALIAGGGVARLFVWPTAAPNTGPSAKASAFGNQSQAQAARAPVPAATPELGVTVDIAATRPLSNAGGLAASSSSPRRPRAAASASRPGAKAASATSRLDPVFGLEVPLP
jgi:serine/threonine-protein kinase